MSGSMVCKRILAVFFTALIYAGFPTPGGRAEEPSAVLESVAQAPLSARLIAARMYFDGLESARYRRAMFALLHEASAMSPGASLEALDITLKISERSGIDGLEPLVVSYTDGIMRRGDADLQEKLDAMLAAARSRIIYRWSSPWPTLLVPVGRPGSRLVFNMRSDAARVIGRALLDSGPLRVEDLLISSPVVKGACALPDVGEVEALAGLASAEERRKNTCSEIMTEGGGQMTAAQSLDVASVDACMNYLADVAPTADEYTTEEMNADLQQCSEDLSGWTGAGNPLASWGSALRWVAGKLAEEAWDAAKDALENWIKEKDEGGDAASERAAYQEFLAQLERQAAANAAARAYADAIGGAVAAALKAGNAANALAKAQAEDDRASEALADARDDLDAAVRHASCEACSAREIADRERELEEARRRYDESKDKKKETERERRDAEKDKKNADDAAADAEGKVTAAEGLLNAARNPPDESQAFKSEACTRMLTNGRFSSPDEMHEALPDDWTDFHSRWTRTSNPSPEEGRPADALALPSCGSDPATTGWAGRDCETPVACVDESRQCGCGPGPSESEKATERLAAGEAVLACAPVRCPDGTQATPRQGFCTCDPEEEASGVPPAPVFSVPLRGPITIFLGVDSNIPSEVARPLDLIGRTVANR